MPAAKKRAKKTAVARVPPSTSRTSSPASAKRVRAPAYESPLEADVAELVLAGRFGDAVARTSHLVVRSETDLLVGAWVLRALEAEDVHMTEDGRVHIARSMLALRPNASWKPHTAHGRRRFLARIKALETLARDARRRGTDLDQGLSWAEEATRLVLPYEDAGPFVTRAKILDLLGRTEEAYAMAKIALDRNPDVLGLEEIRARPRFVRWLAKTKSSPRRASA
ncbi:MAG: hypothetical protein U0169_21820 [Polyangiaceae bacterium]